MVGLQGFIEKVKGCFLTPPPWHQAVVTGIGIVSPIGVGVDDFWKHLCAGMTGIDFISSFDASSFPCRLAGEVRNVRFRDYLSRAQIGFYPRATQLACVAFAQAKMDAGIDIFNPISTDVLVGSASNAFEYIDKEALRNNVSSFGTFDPTGIAKLNVNCTATAIAAQEKINGRVATVSTACASGVTALGMAVERISLGLADTVIAGATDIGVTRFLLNLFCSAKFVSFEKQHPEKAVLPLDEMRTRSVLADGACFFIVESEQAARRRKAKIYGRIAAFSQVNENVGGLFETDKTGQSWAAAIRAALTRSPGAIDYVNAHATGDESLDVVEVKALESVFESGSTPLVSSIKGAIGSPFAAAGALQVASTLLALKEKFIPPNRGLIHPVSTSKLHLVGNKGLHHEIRRALVNSRGLGGINASLICERIAA
jgi:3-oxoacyl-[acyl-carrier-protein] synthase II